jgi:uncharacterized protein (TIGR02302 family)
MKYRLIFLVSYLSLLWERLWNRFWPAVSVILFFAALALLNLPLILEPGWHLVTLAVFAVALAVILLLPTPSPFSFPSRDDVERRIERASALTHRPLQTLRDAPAESLADSSLSLWQQHRQRAALALQQLKIYTPHPDAARRDRWKLRYAAFAFLALGLAIAQKDAGTRLRHAVTPDFSVIAEKQVIALDLWITPPEYTHEATVFLSTAKRGLVAQKAPVTVPSGSILKLRLSGPRLTPRFTYAGAKHPLTEAVPHNYTLEIPLQESGILNLGWFGHLGRWPVTVLPDTPPEVSVSRIEATPRGATKISYKALDDHGIVKLTGIVAVSSGKAYAFSMPPSNAADGVFTEDLTALPAAGETASLWLEAEDATGQKTSSAPASFVLPERHFTSPLAQKIIAERKTLLTPNMSPDRRGIAGRLADIAVDPNLYKGNILIFMSLNSAVKRLLYDWSDEATASVAGLLWDVALKIEDSGLSLAQRELGDALQKLSEALNDKSVPKEQLQDMLDEVKKKMRQYVQALALAMQQKMLQGQKMPVLSPELAQKFMKSLDINKLLDQMRNLSQANSREDLQKMAGNLKDSLDNFDLASFSEMQEKQAQAMQELQNLQEIIHRQQSLFDKTNKTDDPTDIPLLNKEQGGIRAELGQSLRKLGEAGMGIPDNFAKADQAMKGSSDALGRKQAQESLPHQKTALEELQKGLDKAVKKMAESMQQSLLSFGGEGGNSSYGEGFDPLGRQSGRGNGDVKLPDEKERRRVQEIIEELRHRSNEPARTKVERDYIDRLLDQF